MPLSHLQDLVAQLPAPDLGRQGHLRSPISRVREGLVRRRRRKAANGLPDRLEPDAELGIVRPGFNNFGPSAAFVFAFARRHERTVLAYACAGAGPRVCAEVDGVPVPGDLRGRIVAVGAPDWCILSFEAASDLFLRQLLALAHAGLPFVDSRRLLTSRARFLGHSQGALEGLLDRARLESAGLAQAIGPVVGVAPPSAGAPILGDPRATTVLARGARAAPRG